MVGAKLNIMASSCRAMPAAQCETPEPVSSGSFLHQASLWWWGRSNTKPESVCKSVLLRVTWIGHSPGSPVGGHSTGQGPWQQCAWLGAGIWLWLTWRLGLEHSCSRSESPGVTGNVSLGPMDKGGVESSVLLVRTRKAPECTQGGS